MELCGDGRLVGCSRDEAVEGWKSSGRTYWLDVHDFTHPELAVLLDQLEVDPFARQRCLEAGRDNTVIALPRGAFGEWPVYADRACTRRAQAACLVLENLVLTMYPEGLEIADEMRATIVDLVVEKRTPTSLVASLLLQETVVTSRAARSLRDGVLGLTERMDSDPQDVDTEELDDLKRAVLLCDAVAEEQAEAFLLLAGIESRGFDATTVSSTMGLVTTSAGATARLVDRTYRRTESLARRLEGARQDLLNRRLGVLTILSAIFLPLTLLVGVWGMNFENMPELDEPYAYPMALGGMAAIALIMLGFFYWRGWFD
ncbi:MAG: CorA family divalent cation transporter [Myxococcota bacterium]